MRQKNEQYRMERYGRRPTFASFLPGIAGVRGIPIWCYYVNRGQGVVSFGVDNKDHAIMEFNPAHRAYQQVSRTGFRTFVRRDGEFAELFTRPELGAMTIDMNALRLEEQDDANGLATQVDYFVLPEEHVGALVRRVKLTNTGKSACRVEILDGMPELIPYGVGDGPMKNMLQTTKAWMQVENVETRAPYYRVRVSMDDTASVGIVDGGNFAVGYDDQGNRLRVVVDPDAVFDYDTSLEQPVVFQQGGLAQVTAQRQNCSNLLPCAFFAVEKDLEPGQSVAFSEIIGQVANQGILDAFLQQRRDEAYFDGKYSRALELTQELCSGIETKSGYGMFDAYCKYTYMDNVLRGGEPIKLPGDKVFYVYSRKHGDLERDYNFFSMLPEFYSQGNGNFRDVNQNRRSDTFFHPFVGRQNIRTFYSLIQLDGCNPLSVEMMTYSLTGEQAGKLTASLSESQRDTLAGVLAKPFTPGQLCAALEAAGLDDQADGLFGAILQASESQMNASLGEGYWCDHWTYNLDLIEDYLAIFPDRERELLYEQNYLYFLSQVNINPRAKRYEVTPAGVRQYHALDEAGARKTAEKYLRDEKGELVRSTLLEKLILLCTTKFAALDPYGMGVEMEGGKPGWYDALNGLPGLLGSSMAETYELARMLDYTISALERNPGQIDLLQELGALLEKLAEINCAHKAEIAEDDALVDFWNQVNDVKEAYRAKTYQGVGGQRTTYTTARLAKLLSGFAETVACGIRKARAAGVADGEDVSCPTYFAYDVTDYTQDDQGIHPTAFALRRIPAFLEGPVRWLKLDTPADVKRQVYAQVKHSDLYDKKLSMYKVNASLENASFELGRGRAFTPGWLENASIWLHMEYKYLLELLRSGLYQEFFADFHKAGVPFLDEAVYGRSPLENSSFLASSANPNDKLHGRGFVARLSGSTAEFLSIWRLMLFGARLFGVENGELTCTLSPAIPDYLIGSDRQVSAKLLGQTWVTYQLADGDSFAPGNYRIEDITVHYDNGVTATVAGGTLRGALAESLREGGIASLDVRLVR